MNPSFVASLSRKFHFVPHWNLMGKIGELIMTSSFCDSHRKATFSESFRLAIEN